MCFSPKCTKVYTLKYLASPLHYRSRCEQLCSVRLVHSLDASVEHSTKTDTVADTLLISSSLWCHASNLYFTLECLHTLRGEEMNGIPICRLQVVAIFGDTATLIMAHYNYKTENVQFVSHQNHKPLRPFFRVSLFTGNHFSCVRPSQCHTFNSKPSMYLSR